MLLTENIHMSILDVSNSAISEYAVYKLCQGRATLGSRELNQIKQLGLSSLEEIH